MSEQQPPLIQALGARGVIREWVQGAQTLAIFESAYRLGWLDRLQTPTSLPDLTTASWTAERVRGVLDVLNQAGVVTETEGAWQLTPAFAALTAGASGVELGNTLAAARLDLQERDNLDGEAALTIARDSGVAADPVTQMLYQSVYDALPELEPVLNGEGPMVDVGCGVGGALLTTAQLFPKLKLLGVDVVPEVVAETERRRDELGLGEQVEVRCQDAREIPERKAFPVAYWAQSFFPDADRSATLAVLRSALTDDGLLVLQEQPAGPTELVQLAQRGITGGRTVEELVKEAEAAGFTLVRQATTNLGNLALVRNRP